MRYLTNDLDAAGLPTFADSDAELSPYSGPAARFWDFETDDEHPYGAEMLVRVVTTPHGTFRACVRQDEYPEPPDYDMGCPVFRVSNHRDYVGAKLADKPEIGEDSWRHDGLSHDLSYVVSDFARRFGRDNLELTDRWLRIFHGGSLKVLSSSTYQGGDDFVTYDTRAMRAYWGQTGDMLETSDPSAEEWQAYLDGDVYSVAVERAVYDEDEPDEEPTWEELEGPVYGYYGTAWAMQAAEDELHSAIEHRAGQMLPIGGAL